MEGEVVAGAGLSGLLAGMEEDKAGSGAGRAKAGVVRGNAGA